MTDLLALQAVHEHPRPLMPTAALAAVLEVTEDEASARITTLVSDGFLFGPMWAGFEGAEWTEQGVSLTRKARELLGVK
jgi:hypothetical protein